MKKITNYESLFHDMENVFSEQFTAYRENYNSKYGLILLIEELREYLDSYWCNFNSLVEKL